MKPLTPPSREGSVRKLAVIAICIVLPRVGAAQQGPVELEDITVIGTRTELSVLDNPRSVTVINQEQLERQAPRSIAEALRDVPGIELVDSSVPGMKRLRIRGESSRRVTILVDGQEITDHSTYGTPILINPAAVERIDVIRGPSSVLYGAKAIGGVVNIITKTGVPDKAAELELGGTYYSGTSGKQGWVSLGGTSGDLDYRVTGGLAKHQDQRTPEGQYTDTGRLENTAFENDDISAHFGYRLGSAKNHYLALKLDQYRLDSESWKDPSTITGRPPAIAGVTDFTIDLPERDRRKIGLFYDATNLGGPVTKVHVDAYYQTVDRLFENTVETFTPAGSGRSALASFNEVRSTSDDVITNYGVTGQVDLELMPGHYSILGAQYLADVLETDKTTRVDVSPRPPFPPGLYPIESASFAKARIDTWSLFGQDEWSILPDLRLFLGLRFNRIETELEEIRSTQLTSEPGSSTDNELSSSLALVYDGIENATLRALYSSGYISPTLLQSFGRTSAGGRTVFGNPDLKLETADNFELGVRYDAQGLILDAVGFYTRAQDYISTVDCGTAGTDCPTDSSRGTPNRIYANVDEATTYGVELLTQYTIPKTAITPYASAAWTRRQLDFDELSTTNTNVPALSGRLGIRYERELSGWSTWIDLFTRASTSVKETLPTEEGPVTREVDGWATLNLALGGFYGAGDKYRLVLEFNNITDEEYRPLLDALPGVGRSLDLTVAVRF